MYSNPSDISIERLLAENLSEGLSYENDILMLGNLGDMRLFSHPVRLKATTVFLCLEGEITCSINLKNFTIKANYLLVNFVGDIIHVQSTKNVRGYALVLSEDYLQKLQLDFRLRTHSYISIRGNGPISIPYDEIASLKPYFELFKKNIEEGNPDVLKGLTEALSYTLISLISRQSSESSFEAGRAVPRSQQLFERFMKLLQVYHNRERTVQFYAEKMCLTPKYFAGAIKSYSGRAVLDWINEYVVLEAKMLLRYTGKSIQEISYSLNFPTQSAFGKYFKQQTGVGPKQYRYDEQRKGVMPI